MDYLNGGALAVTSGATWAVTGSVVVAGLVLVVLGSGMMLAARYRRRADDQKIG